MEATALYELHKAMYQVLSSYQPLADKVSGIYDDVPQGTSYPYVTIGEPTSTPRRTKLSVREEVVFVLHCFSDYPNKSEAYQILDMINKAFHTNPISLGGRFSMFHHETEQMNVFTDVDGASKHGIIRLRLVIYQ